MSYLLSNAFAPAMDPRVELRQIGIRPSKGLGQHFLVDTDVARRQVEYADIVRSDVVLEIGPGLGVLTSLLAERAGRVIAVEKDKRLAERIESLSDNLEVIVGDGLTVDLPRFNKVVSNLPYQISSPITFRLLEEGFDLAVLMYQQEFAERLVAKVSTSQYSRLTVGVCARADCELLEVVPRSAFYPSPRVDSSVVRLKTRSPPFHIEDMKLFDQVVTAVFAHRRKKVQNCLMLAGGTLLGKAISNIPSLPFLTSRAEDLTPSELAELSNAICRAKG